jgi:hypothetical protein
MAGDHIMQTIQSLYPALNVMQRNEPVATDTIYTGMPAISTGGQKMAQLFMGRILVLLMPWECTTKPNS